MIGTIIKDQYRIVELLGEGGMGVVYKAFDLELERLVALKFLKAELGASTILIQRFRDELRTLASFNHPNIATLFTSLTWEARPVMVMELVEGETLSDMVELRGPIPAHLCVPLICQALAGVGLAHRRKIIHRDLKPANLMLNTDGVIKVMDFGIAKIQSSPGLTGSNTGMGTTYYMAPEQIRGSVDARTDIYAMGITLYELLAGQVPFRGSSQYDIEHAHIQEIPQPPTLHYPHIPEPVVRAVMRSLEKDPAARFQSAEEFSAALSQSPWEAGSMEAASISAPGPFSHPEEARHSPPPPTHDPTPPPAVPKPQPHKQSRASKPQTPLIWKTPTPPSGAETNEIAGGTLQSQEPPYREPITPRRLIAAAAVVLLGAGVYWSYTALSSSPALNSSPALSSSTAPISNTGSVHSGGSRRGDETRNVHPGGTVNDNGIGNTVPTQIPPKRPPAHVIQPSHKADPASIIRANDGLSGSWTGRYDNLCSGTGSAQVKMSLSATEGGGVSGSLRFDSAEGLHGTCSLRGSYISREKSLTLGPSGCNGTVPGYLEGTHKSALRLTGSTLNGTVNPEDKSTCVQVSLSRESHAGAP